MSPKVLISVRYYSAAFKSGKVVSIETGMVSAKRTCQKIGVEISNLENTRETSEDCYTYGSVCS